MKHVKRSMLVCLLTIVLTTLLSAGVVQAAGQTGATWSIVKSPNVRLNSNFLQGVAAVSATDIWAVGGYASSGSVPATTLIEHWNGNSWKIVPSPNVASSLNDLKAVAAVSATDIWAVGDYLPSNVYQTLIEHWDGSSWQIVSSPNNGLGHNELNGVAVVSANDVWAVGGGGGQTLIEHWNGSSWQVVASPSPGSGGNELFGVAVVSASNLWAVGDYSNGIAGPEQTLIEHWNGSSWQVVASPTPDSSGDFLQGVAAVSASNIWAVGFGTGTLTEHWNGSNWQVVASPSPDSSGDRLRAVAVVSASDVWAVGSGSDTLIEHWNGSSWKVVPSPNPGLLDNELHGVAAVSANDIWAVGFSRNSTRGPYHTLIEHGS